MDERDLLREIEDYAQELSRVAEEHHDADRRAENFGSQGAAPTLPNRLRRSVLVTVVLAMVLAAGAIAAVVRVDGSSTPRPKPRVSNSVPARSSDATAARLAGGAWTRIPAAPISTDREGASVAWTGHELIVWGGTTGRNHDQLRADGAAYNPSTQTWRILPASPLSARIQQAGAWTGRELVIWGGYDNENDLHATADGAAYSPTTNTWRRLPTAPISARVGPIAVWTGSEVVVLGGRPATSTPRLPSYSDGAAYNPASDTWRHISAPVAPNHDPITWRLAVSIGGDRVLAWSVWQKTTAVAPSGPLGGADAFVYDNTTGTWTIRAAAPGALADPQEVLWTGKYAVVRGQIEPYSLSDGPGPTSETTARYDPAVNAWTPVADDALVNPALLSAWTGRALFSYSDSSNGPSDASVYDPARDSWTRLPRTPAGCGGAPTWAGTRILIVCAGLVPPSASGLAYSPGPVAPQSQTVPPRQAAIALSRQMLDDVGFPSAVHPFDGPAPKGSPLGYEPGIANLVFASRAWTVNTSPETLWRWLRAHAPDGFVVSGVGSDDGALAKWNLTYAMADAPTNISDAEVQLAISGGASGPAVIHGYAIAGWTNPRPADEFVPAADTSVTITVVHRGKGPSAPPVGKTVVLSDSAPAHMLIHEFNALRVLPPHSIYHGCFPLQYVFRVAFARSAKGDADIVAELPGCVSVDVAVDGHASATLLDGPTTTLLTSVGRILGLTKPARG